MTISEHQTKLLVAVGAFGNAYILAAIGELAYHEIESYSEHIGEHHLLDRKRPTRLGLYVWEGIIHLDDGVGSGELGGQGDGDIEWDGQYRPVELFDLAEFVAALPPQADITDSVTCADCQNLITRQDLRASGYLCPLDQVKVCLLCGCTEKNRCKPQGLDAALASVNAACAWLTIGTEGAVVPVCSRHTHAEGDEVVARLEREAREAVERNNALQRGAREVFPHLPDHASVQCATCLLVHSKTDLETDGFRCRECGDMICVACGCTDRVACDEGCSWIKPGVCSTHGEEGDEQWLKHLV